MTHNTTLCVLCCARLLQTTPPGCVSKALTLIWSPFSVHYAGPLGRPQQIRTISTPLTSSLKLKWHLLHSTCHTHTIIHTDQRAHTNSGTCEDASTTHPETFHTNKFLQIDNPSKDTVVQNIQPSNTHTQSCLVTHCQFQYHFPSGVAY